MQRWFTRKSRVEDLQRSHKITLRFVLLPLRKISMIGHRSRYFPSSVLDWFDRWNRYFSTVVCVCTRIDRTWTRHGNRLFVSTNQIRRKERSLQSMSELSSSTILRFLSCKRNWPWKTLLLTITDESVYRSFDDLHSDRFFQYTQTSSPDEHRSVPMAHPVTLSTAHHCCWPSRTSL